MPWLPELHTPDDDRRYLREVVLPETEVWVAETDGAVTGFTALGTRAGVEFMEHLYVAPEHQRRGIGSALMEKAKTLRPAGFRLWVFQRTSTSATASGSSSSRTGPGTRRRSPTRSTNGPAQARNPRVRIPCARDP